MHSQSLLLSRFALVIGVLVGSVVLSLPAGATAEFAPNIMPTLETTRLVETIEIDGRLEESGWQSAGRAFNFTERSPGDNVRPLVETKTYITYDDDHLYIAFVCLDDPELVRSTMCQRDQFYGDDAVVVKVDTYGEAAWAYEFIVNPYGIQKDRLWTSVQGSDAGFDLVWQSAAMVTDSGYQVEIAIPFSTMRFPDKERQSWRMDFGRIHPRESYREYAWSANDRNEQCEPCQWGTVTGFTGIRPGRGLEILPSFISNQSGAMDDNTDAASEFGNDDILGDVSLGAKYALTSDITAELTLNPDFSQIEADAGQIDVNTTIALMFPERRPFFQEGSDLFRTYFNSFYTRMVNDPEMAVKGTARWDRTSLAYMTARDENSPYMIPTEGGSYNATPGKSTVNVVRGLHSLGNNSQLGFMVTDRRYDGGGSGTILAADGSLRLTRNYSVIGQFVANRSTEPDGIEIDSGVTFDDGRYTVDLDGESFSGTAMISEFRRRGNWSFTIDYNQLTPTYRTQTGYDPWNDQKNMFVFTNYSFYPSGGPFERITPNAYFDRRWNFGNRRKWAHANASVNARLRWAQTSVNVQYGQGSELWSGTEFKDLWSVDLNLNSRPHDAVGFFLSTSFGQQVARMVGAKGDERNLRFSLDLKPIDRLIIEPNVDYAKSTASDDGSLLYRQMIVRTRFRFQMNPRLSLRVVVQRDDSEAPGYAGWDRYHLYFGRQWTVDPLLTYRLNSFSVFYLGSSHDYHDFNADNVDPVQYKLTSRQFFMKVQYLFQT